MAKGASKTQKENTKDKGGRPCLYPTPEKLGKAIDQYFAECVPTPMMYETDEGEQAVVTDAKGKPVILLHPPTVAGLAYSLGYASRQSLHDLEKMGDKYSYLIKRARLKIEEGHEENLTTRDKPTGDIFWLKNHAGYMDKQEVYVPTDNRLTIDFTE